MRKELPPSLKVGTGWIELEIISEPDVVLTFRGYAPILHVEKISNNLKYIFYISASSLGQTLEELRQNNTGTFTGIQFRVRKKDATPMAPYEIEAIE